MTKYILRLILITTTIGTDVYAQTTRADSQFVIKSGHKQFDLNKLTVLEINRKIVSNGKDSISCSIVPDSIYKVSDTLFVKPFIVEENRFLDVDNPYSKRQYYDYRTKTVLKIPLDQIEKIRAKKQPIAFVLGTTTTLAYLTFITSTFVAVASPVDTGKKLILISGAVLITAWPSYFIWGKKRFWFQNKHKKRWTFD